MKVRTMRVASLVSVLTLAPLANASLIVTNGDFENGAPAGVSITDVTDWFDDNTSANFWDGAWHTTDSNITPNGTAIAQFSAFGANGGSYLYQSIGTAEPGDTALQIYYDFGSPNDTGAGRVDGMSVLLYAFDGLGSFVAGDNVDINAAFTGGGSGLSLLGTAADVRTATGIDGDISSYMHTVSLSGAGSQELFLTFTSTSEWPSLDNVSVTAIPEPSTLGLCGIGMIGLMARRIRKRLA